MICTVDTCQLIGRKLNGLKVVTPPELEGVRLRLNALVTGIGRQVEEELSTLEHALQGNSVDSMRRARKRAMLYRYGAASKLNLSLLTALSRWTYFCRRLNISPEPIRASLISLMFQPLRVSN